MDINPMDVVALKNEGLISMKEARDLLVAAGWILEPPAQDDE